MDEILPKQKVLTNEQRKILSAKRIHMEVSPFEAQAIKEMRKFSHGRFIIQIIDFIPIRYVIESSRQFEETDLMNTLTKTERSI